MASAQDIRRRIKSVKNIGQITKAMKMVAAARLRRAQERAAASQPYMQKIRQVLANVACTTEEAIHPLLSVREVNRTGYVVVSSDKGLAGAFSSNLMREAVAQIRQTENYGLLTVGRKSRDFFRRRNYTVDDEFTGFSEKPTYEHAIAIANAVADGFVAGKYDEVYMVYTHFISPMQQRPTVIKLLPLEDMKEGQTCDATPTEYIFEPSPAGVLATLLPKYLETVIYGALLQSAASELGARMTAMSSATDNAQELISKLILNYNKVRQATITREISEIVGGAEALK